MVDSKKEILKNFLLEGDDNTKREKFVLAWDIWENFESILTEASNNIFTILKNRIKELIKESYEITSVNYTHRGIYVAKPKWKQEENDRGIYALSIEKWGKNDPLIVGVVRNSDLFTTDAEKELAKILSSEGFLKRSPGWLAYTYLDGQSFKVYYTDVFLNPNKIVEMLFDSFEKLYRTIRDTEGLEELMDKAVEERKAQLRLPSNN